MAIHHAAILDAYSRKCIGWELSRFIDTKLALAALRMALRERRPPPGFIHHSDRGVQYASREYSEALESAGARISMSGKGNPYDNAKAESFFKTLKREEVYLKEYRTIEEADANIGHFIRDVYNQKRLHSSLGYYGILDDDPLSPGRVRGRRKREVDLDTGPVNGVHSSPVYGLL